MNTISVSSSSPVRTARCAHSAFRATSAPRVRRTPARPPGTTTPIPSPHTSNTGAWGSGGNPEIASEVATARCDSGTWRRHCAHVDLTSGRRPASVGTFTGAELPGVGANR
jgi:hypothetical protein